MQLSAKNFETNPVANRKRGVNTPIAESGSVPHHAHAVPVPVAGCLLVCAQCEAIACTLTNEQFTARVSGKASIGAHLRHCVEHFQMLLDGLNTKIIDYDARPRNAQLEICPEFLLSTIRDIAQKLQCFDETSLTRPIDVRVLFAPNTEPLIVSSTLGRELGFVSGHAIHHIAMVKMIAQSLNASLPDEYGIGHATMSHRSICIAAPSRA